MLPTTRPGRRTRAAASLATCALAGAGLVAVGAVAAGTAVAAPGGSDATAPVVDVTITADGVQLSTDTTAPGNTVFDVRKDGGRGSIELLQLADGYSYDQATSDFQKIFSGKLKAIRRVDRNVDFYGGVAPKAGHDEFGTALAAGDYLLVDLDTGTEASLTVAGDPQTGELPAVDGSVDYAGEDSYDAASHLPDQGWFSQTNETDEPHFTVFQKVKAGTTRKQVRRYFKQGAHGKPPFALDEEFDALPISPGHTTQFSIDASAGTYVLACFWPDDQDGMPHALMGMWDLAHLG